MSNHQATSLANLDSKEISRRLHGNVARLQIIEELIASGMEPEAAAQLVLEEHRRTLRRTGVRYVVIGLALAGVSAALISADVEPEVLGAPLLFTGVFFLLGVFRLIRSFFAASAWRLGEKAASQARESPDWLSRAIRRETASRARALFWICVPCLLFVITAPIAIMAWILSRRMRQQSERAIALLESRSESLVWAYLRQVSSYGVTTSALMLGARAETGQSRLLTVPVPAADAESALAEVANRFPEISLGFSRDHRKAFRRNPAALRHTPALAS